MIIDRLDPEGLRRVPGTTNVTVATGSRLVHISGQSGVDADGNIVGLTHYEQFCRAIENVCTALEAAGATFDDIAKLTFYIVDYDDRALNAMITAIVDTLGRTYPVAAATILGVASLWQEGLLVEIDAVAVV
jgi:enamine deaminase RidA (YjgF/YER057c/UK114 family)